MWHRWVRADCRRPLFVQSIPDAQLFITLMGQDAKRTHPMAEYGHSQPLMPLTGNRFLCFFRIYPFLFYTYFEQLRLLKIHGRTK